MPFFAVVENREIINFIVADSRSIAESVTEKECIEHTEDFPIQLGWYWSNEYTKYIPPSPYPSWTEYDGKQWLPPVPHPDITKLSAWDEENLQWVIFEPAADAPESGPEIES